MLADPIQMNSRERRKHPDYCGCCGKLSPTRKCIDCKLKANRWYLNRKARGICPACGRLETGGAICVTCLDKSSKKSKNARIRLRDEALAAYGNVCTCCGEKERAFLEIDHVNNDGSKHRRELSTADLGCFYRWLKKRNYPEGFQLLCSNCNRAKWRYGVCPHKGPITEDYKCLTKPSSRQRKAITS